MGVSPHVPPQTRLLSDKLLLQSIIAPVYFKPLLAEAHMF